MSGKSKAAQTAAKNAKASIVSTRSAIASGLAPTIVATSGSARQYVARLVSAAPSGSQKTMAASVGFGLMATRAGSTVGPARPELDRVEISSGMAGTEDASQCTVVFSFSAADVGKIRLARVMRADIGVSPRAVTLSPRAVGSLVPFVESRKSQDPLYRVAASISGSSVGSTITNVVRDDAEVGYRTVSGMNSKLRILKSPLQSNRRAGNDSLYVSSDVDPSVAADPQFYINRRTFGDVSGSEKPLTLSVGANFVGPDMRTSFVAKTEVAQLPLAKPESPFIEISTIGIDSRSGRTVGDFIEMAVVDPTVLYGRRYAYYVVLVDNEMRQSVRSRIVNADVVLTDAPPTPIVSYVLIAGRPRFSISAEKAAKFEVYVKGARRPRPAGTIGGSNSIIQEDVVQDLDSGFRPGFDIAADSRGNGTYVDVFAQPGETLRYRFFSVSAFDVKAQTPFECEITIPDPSRRTVVPQPEVSLDKTIDGHVKLSVSVTSDDVIGFTILRRDVTMFEKAFHTPNQPSWAPITSRDFKRRASSEGSRIITPSYWRGYVENTNDVNEMVDLSVSIDRIYQYAVCSHDIRGNVSDQTVTRQIGIYVGENDAPPTMLTASFDGTNVNLSWRKQDETLDQTFSPDNTIELFQVERREDGQQVWAQLRVGSSQSFVDTVDQNGLERAKKYWYRVSSISRDGNQSIISEAVNTFTELAPAPVSSLRVRSTSLAVKPFANVISWEYDGTEVDSWHVERAVVNKFAASRLTSLTSGEIAALPFVRVATVCRESSRGVSRAIDKTVNLDRSVFIGNRAYIDRDISLENSYYYRVRAVSNGGLTSEWSIRGILLADSPFDRKLVSLTDQEERATMAKTIAPATVKGKPR